MIESLFPLGVAHYIVGGLFVGLGISIPFILTGLVAGVSTTFTSTWSYVVKGWFFQKEGYIRTRAWHLALIAGLCTGGFLYTLLIASDSTVPTAVGLTRLFCGGMLIAIGARMSGGCTSGHAICGSAALEKVSFIATAVFLVVAIVAAHVITIFLGS